MISGDEMAIPRLGGEGRSRGGLSSVRQRYSHSTRDVLSSLQTRGVVPVRVRKAAASGTHRMAASPNPLLSVCITTRLLHPSSTNNLTALLSSPAKSMYASSTTTRPW